MQVFSDAWFKKHQKRLLKLAKSRIGRIIFRISKDDLSFDKEIVKISPRSFHWIDKIDENGIHLCVDIRPHHKFAKRLFYTFKPFWYVLHFIDWVCSFSPFPQLRLNFGFDTLTAYPVAGANSPVDGWVVHDSFFGDTFANIRGGAGIDSNVTDANFRIADITAYEDLFGPGDWFEIIRSIFLFDTNEVISGSTINSATFSVYGLAKDNGVGDLDLSLIGSTPASNDDLVNADYSQLGSTRYASDISYASYSTSGYNDFTLNATGRSNIVAEGITKLGVRIANDLDNSEPTWADFFAASSFSAYYADETGISKDPKLVVNYTLPIGFHREELNISDETFLKFSKGAITETLTLNDVVSTKLTKKLSISETFTLSDVVTSKSTFKRQFNESMTLNDNVTTKMTFRRQFEEILVMNGDIDGTAAILRQKTAISPVWILKCSFNTEIVYISDHEFDCDSLDGGITTLGWIKDWASISEDISGQIGQSKVSDITLQILIDYDYTNNIHELIWNLSEDVEAIDCDLYVWVKELEGEDKPPIKVWAGNIIDYRQLDELNYTIQFVDESVRLDNKIGNLASTSDYPNIDPDDVGRMIPIVYGSVEYVPALAIDAGWITTLAEDITDSQTTIEVTDAEGLSNGDTIQIEDEQILIGTISGDTLSGCTRAQGSTTATTHDTGIHIGKIQTEYWYLLADHAVKSIGDVFVDGVRQTGGDFTKYTDHSGKAKVKFTALPVLRKSVDVEVDDNIKVTDFAVSHSDGITHTATRNEEQVASSTTDHGPGANWSEGVGNKRTVARFTHPGFSYSRIILKMWVRILIENGFTNDTVFVRLRSLASPFPTSSWVTFAFHPASGSYTFDQNVILTFSSISSGDVLIEAYHESSGTEQLDTWTNFTVTRSFSEDATVTGTGSSSKVNAIKDKISGGKSYYVALEGNSSADVVIGTQITAHMDGYEDDGSGTITGTPNALIERPDHVIKHFLNTYGDITLADFYTDASSFFSSKSYVFAGIMNKNNSVRTWMDQLAWQCRCYFKFSAGVASLLWRPDSLDSLTTIIDRKIRSENGRTKLTGPRPSPLTELINVFEVLYNRDWTLEGEDAYRGILKEPTTPASDLSVQRYGQKSKPDLFRFDFVVDEAIAQDLLTFYRNTYKDRKKVFEVEVYLDLFDLTFGKGVTLHPKDDILCEVQAVDLHPGNGRSKRIDKVKLKLKES